MDYRKLIESVASQTGLTQQQARLAIDSLAYQVKLQVRSGKIVSISGLGRFSAIIMAPTRRRNIATGEVVSVPKRRAVRFYPSKTGFVVK